jgi:hypothetical protein
MPTRSEIKVVGSSGQISLGKRYAGTTLTLERLDDGAILLRPVTLVPEQRWAAQDEAASEIAERAPSPRAGRRSAGADAAEPTASGRTPMPSTPDWVAEWLRHRIPPATGPTAREILEEGRARRAGSPRTPPKRARPRARGRGGKA